MESCLPFHSAALTATRQQACESLLMGAMSVFGFRPCSLRDFLFSWKSRSLVIPSTESCPTPGGSGLQGSTSPLLMPPRLSHGRVPRSTCTRISSRWSGSFAITFPPGIQCSPHRVVFWCWRLTTRERAYAVMRGAAASRRCIPWLLNRPSVPPCSCPKKSAG
jgi:hypothetical protein